MNVHIIVLNYMNVHIIEYNMAQNSYDKPPSNPTENRHNDNNT